MRNRLRNPQHGHLCCSNVQHRTSTTRLRRADDPMGRSRIDRQATPLSSLHRVWSQGRDIPAPLDWLLGF